MSLITTETLAPYSSLSRSFSQEAIVRTRKIRIKKPAENFMKADYWKSLN
jgi:hypothetical protein